MEIDSNTNSDTIAVKGRGEVESAAARDGAGFCGEAKSLYR
jgi:hypothetical protein